MSTPAILFSAYFVIGLLLMVVAVASPGKEKRTKGIDIFAYGGGDIFHAGLLIFIAVLWPIWLIALLVRKHPKE